MMMVTLTNDDDDVDDDVDDDDDGDDDGDDDDDDEDDDDDDDDVKDVVPSGAADAQYLGRRGGAASGTNCLRKVGQPER
jgi:hypothetical protein